MTFSPLLKTLRYSLRILSIPLTICSIKEPSAPSLTMLSHSELKVKISDRRVPSPGVIAQPIHYQRAVTTAG